MQYRNTKHEKSATRKNCNVKIMQHEESPTGKECSAEKVQHEKVRHEENMKIETNSKT